MEENKAVDVEAVKASVVLKIATLRGLLNNLKGANPDLASLQAARDLIGEITADAASCGIAAPAVGEFVRDAEAQAAEDAAKAAVMEYEYEREQEREKKEHEEIIEAVPHDGASWEECNATIASLEGCRTKAGIVAEGMGKQAEDTYLGPAIEALATEEARLKSIAKSHKALDELPLAPEVKTKVDAIREARHAKHEAYQEAREKDTALGDEGLGSLFEEEPQEPATENAGGDNVNVADKLVGAIKDSSDTQVSSVESSTLKPSKIELSPKEQEAINKMLQAQKAAVPTTRGQG